MSGYNRTSGQSYNYSNGTYTDQYGNVIGTTGNDLDRAYHYWQSRAGSGAFTQVGEGLDRPEYGDRWKGHSEYNPAYSYYRAMGIPIRNFYYASDTHSEAEIERYDQLIEEFEAGPVSVVGSPEYTRAQKWFREAVPTLISNTNVARDNLVDYFGMEKELAKIGYSEEEIGKALNKSKMSSYVGMAFSTGAKSAGFADAYTKIFNDAKIYGGITEDFQKAYDKKAPEYHDKNFARLVSLSMTDPQAYQREYAKMNLRDKNVYMFKAYDKGLFEDPAERTRLEEAGVAPEEINKRIELSSMNKYKEAVVSNLHESGNYGDVYKRPATKDAELLGFDVVGGDPESEWVVKTKGSPFQDAGGTSGGQYGYQRIKFFPEETLRASGVYGPESKYNNYLQSESSLEEKLARQSVGKMETIGGLGEYVDVSPEDETLLEGVVNFADLALSIFNPTYNLIKIGVNAAQGETLHLADYISAGLSALKVLDIIAAPMGAEEAAEVGATASANVLEAGGTAAQAARASDQAIALALAGKGLTLPGMSKPLTYAQTVGLANSITEGNPAAFVLSTFGGDMLDAAFAKYGVDPESLPAGVKEGIVKAVGKVGQGEDWDEALSSGAYAWFKSSDLGDGFLGELQQVGRDIDSTYLQPLKDSLPDLGGVVGDWPVWGEISESTGQLIDGFQDIIGGMNDLVPGITDFTQEIANSVLEVIPTESIEEALSKIGQMTGGAFNKLPAAAQDALEEGLQSAIIDGEVDSLAMAEAVSAAVITTDAINEAFPERLTDVVSARIITSAVRNSVTAAMSGGDVSDAFVLSIAQGAANAAKKSLREGTWKDDLQGLVDRVEGDYTDTNNLRAAVDKGAVDYATKAKEYNDLVIEMNSEEAEVLRLAEKAASTGAQADETAFNAARDAFQTKIVDTYAPQLSTLVQDIDSIKVKRDEDVSKYTASLDNLDTATVLLNDNLTPVYADIDKLTVEGINPDFDVKFYARQNGITEEEAYKDYLTNGLYTNAPANQTALTAQNTATVNNVLNDLAASTGLDLTKLAPEQMKAVVKRLEQVAQGQRVYLKDLDVAAVAQNALSVINNPEGTGDEFFSMTTDADGNVTSFEYGSSSAGFNRAEGVTNQDVLSGAARAQVNPETGQYEWTKVPPQTYVAEGQLYQYDAETGQPYTTNAKGEREDVDFIALGNIDPFTPDVSPTLQDLADKNSPAYNPEVFTEELNNSATVDDGGNVVADESWADWLLGAFQDGATYLQGDEDTAPASEAAQNAYANGIRATAGIIEAFNGFSTLFGSDPAGTAAGKFAADMAKIGEGANTAGYQEAVGGMREFQKSLQTKDDPNTPIVYDENGEYVSGDESKKSLWEGAQGIFKTAANHPAAFFGEYISVEFMQEAAPLLVGGLATIAGRATAKVLGSELTKELAEEAAQVIGRKAGLTAAAATDVAEAWAGTAGGAYEQGHATFMKMAGKEADRLELSGPARTAFLADQDTKAREYALNLAINSGNVAGVMAIGSLAVGGLALEKLFINGKPPVEFEGLYNEIARRLSEGATITVKEGVTEAFEEGAATGYTSGQLSLIDPDIDVMGDVGAAAALGGIVGGTISGGIYSISSTGDFVSDLLISNNPAALELLNNPENYSQEELNYQLNNFLGDPQAATDAMNFLYDEVYTSTAEATDALEALGLPYTPEDVTNTTGSTPDADLDDELASYWAITYGTDTDTDGDGILNSEDSSPDSPYTDVEADRIAAEEAAAAQAEAEAQAQAEADRIAAEEAAAAQAEAEAQAQAEADRLAEEEKAMEIRNQIEADRLAAEEEAARLAEEARLAQEEADRLAEEAKLADVADREAAQEAARLAAEEAARLAEEAAVARDAVASAERDAIAARVGTRAVEDDPNTEENEFAEATGIYKEIEDLLAQGNSIEEAIAKVAGDFGETEEAILTALGTTEDELRNEFETGLADVAARVGTRAVEDDPNTEENEFAEATGIYKEIEDLLAEGNSIEEAIAKVAGDLGETKETILTALGTTEDELRNEFETGFEDVAGKIGTRAVEDDPNTEEDESAEATGIYKEIEDLLAQGNSIEEAIAKVAGDLGETEEAILTALGTTEDELRNEFETGFEDVATKLGDMETDILYKMKEYQDQNLTADEALSRAIDDVSTDLGKTKEEILTELGETEASLITRFDEGMADLGLEIDNVANFVGKPASEITATDVDFYADYIAQQEVLSEVDSASYVPTDQQLQYDVNNDGVIDAADQALVQQAFEGKDVTLGGKFESTGLYAYNDAIAAQQKLEAEQQFKEEQELEQQRQFELQTQIDQNQRLNKFDDEIRRVAEMQAAQPTVATTKKMGLAQIGPQYGFDTIFANKQQEQAYGTPFGGYGPSSSPLGQSPFGVRKASGGIIKDSTDRLLKIIGED